MSMDVTPEIRETLDDPWFGLSHGLRRDGPVDAPDGPGIADDCGTSCCRGEACS